MPYALRAERQTPRDIICCLADFKLKEDILKKARGKQLSHQGAPIQLFQDLCGITLKHRQDLRPLLDVLRDKNIGYKWKFPFCLSASHQGRTALLKVPEDLPCFCDTLGIPLVAVPDWYAAYRQIPSPPLPIGLQEHPWPSGPWTGLCGLPSAGCPESTEGLLRLCKPHLFVPHCWRL